MIALTAPAYAQQLRLERLPEAGFDVLAPSSRVDGRPGGMRVTNRSCGELPASQARHRIVNVAVQEWGFFGFGIVVQMDRAIFMDNFVQRL